MSLKLKEVIGEDLESLHLVLVDRMPQSCRTLNIARMQLRGLMPSNIVTKFYAFGETLKTSFIFSFQYFKGLPGGGYYIVLSSPEEDPLNESFLAELEGFLDWTGPLHLDVPGDGVVCRFFEAIAIRRRNEKRNTRLSIHDTFGYVMSTEDAFALSLDKMLETGSNLVLKQLSTEDEISVVRTNWSWGVSALTPGIVDELVHSLPCVGVFVEGKLASWGLTSFYGSISGLGTLEGYRKRGLAKLAIAAVCKAHAEFGMIPCGRTHRSNIPAFRSFESVGYSRTHETNWIDYSEF